MSSVEIPAELIRQAESCNVYLRRLWDSEWTLEPHLFCNWLTFTASPTISSAEFEWRYGWGRRQADAEFYQVPYLDRIGWWVRVDVQPAEGDPITWVGLIVEDGDNPHGSLGGNPAGVQKLLAYGPEILLERQTITTSYFDQDGAVKRVMRGITFNDTNNVRPTGGVDKRAHDDRPGNRSAVTSEGDYVFAGDLAAAERWSSFDMAFYLLKYHVPRDSDGEQTVPIYLDAMSGGIYLPDWDKPVIAQHGRKLREVLNELMDRRRMLGYTLRYSLTENIFYLHPFSYADEAIDLGDGREFAANYEQISISFDAAIDVAECNIKESDAQRYDQVIAAGAKIICCGTIGGKDNGLVSHWTDEQRDAYNAGASGAADYAGLEQFDKDDRNKAIRASEELRRVYSYFGLNPYDFEVLVGDGENVANTVPLFAASLADMADDDVPWYTGEMRFLRQLPLKTDHDYGGTNIESDNVADNTPPGMTWHYRDTFVLLKLPPGPDGTERSGGTRYVDATRLGHACDAEIYGDGNGANFSCSVRVQPDAPGIIVRVHGGVGQHEIAGSEFVPLDAETDPAGTFDWLDNMIVTFAMEADCHVEARYPATLPSGLDAARILRLDASRSANNPEAVAGLHYVAPGTVVGLNDGQLVRSASGGLVRDDRKLLERMARAAYEWYGRMRQAMTLSYRQVCNQFYVGQLITHVGTGVTEEPIRTVITEVRLDFAHNAGETHRTTIQTQWAELDVLKLL